MRIGLISDTHSHLDEKVFDYFAECDEIWHAGDIGKAEIADKLEKFKPFRAVFGNIDGLDIRGRYPEDLLFECEGMKIFITHIGGYPNKYATRVKNILEKERPDLFICGHSHILKVMPDKKLDLLHINPGAAGLEGWHKIKTLIRFTIENKKISQLEVIELGSKGIKVTKNE